jgi:tRNA nucleotidyltransferase (CCA-adding enzyme)
MARRGHTYPHVRISAGDLVNTALGSLAPRARVDDELLRATRLDLTGFVAPRDARVVLREDLRRAAALGLGGLPAARVARAIPVVDAGTSEITVRRELARGAPLVLIREGTTSMGAVAPPGPEGARAMGLSLAPRLGAALDQTAHRLLRRVARLAEGQGSRAFAVGGVVRDAVRGEIPNDRRDLDVVVDGDGLAVARLLAAETGGKLVEHRRFLTASMVDPGGRRVDVATARAESYEVPGALPHVRPATIDGDLHRRDFTENAMAAELSSESFCLVDPLGGRRDVQERRLRVLHPLSFVEDPTRLFRAARYAARLGLTPDPWTVECRRLALELAPFDALSGARLIAELKLVLNEAQPERALAMLGTDDVFRLLDRDYRYTPTTASGLGRLGSTLAWSQTLALAVIPVELLLLVLLDDQTPRIAAGALRRLSVNAESTSRLLAVLQRTRLLLTRLRAASTRSAAARDLRGRAGLELAWLWLHGDTAVRRTVMRFLERDAAVEPWLSGDEVIALGIPRGPAVGRVLAELRDGRLDRTLPGRAAARHHVRRRASAPGAGWAGG